MTNLLRHVFESLDRSELDLAIGTSAVQGERFSVKRLLRDQFVVVLRWDHPAAKELELSAEKLADLSQLQISSAQFAVDFGEDAGRSKRGGRPAIRASFLSAASILSASDHVLVLPLNVARDR